MALYALGGALAACVTFAVIVLGCVGVKALFFHSRAHRDIAAALKEEIEHE